MTGTIIAAVVPGGSVSPISSIEPSLVDVVVDAVHVLDVRDDVVEEDRLAGDDHLALHATAGAVEGKGRQRLGIHEVSLDPRVLAADQVGALVVGGDDHTVVPDDVAQELAKALVDALGLERLAQLPRGVEQELRDLRLARVLGLVHRLTVDDWRAVVCRRG